MADPALPATGAAPRARQPLPIPEDEAAAQAAGRLYLKPSTCAPQRAAQMLEVSADLALRSTHIPREVQQGIGLARGQALAYQLAQGLMALMRDGGYARHGIIISG